MQIKLTKDIFLNFDKSIYKEGNSNCSSRVIVFLFSFKFNSLYFLPLVLYSLSSGKDEPEVRESVLEGKILNQLIQQIPSDKIPQTNFRVKKKISTGSVIAKTLETIALLTAIVYFVCFNQWKSCLLYTSRCV